MTDDPRSAPAVANEALRPEDELSLIDYAMVVWRHRWLVGGLVFLSLFATLGYTLRQPKIYESKATLLGPQESQGALGMLGGLAGASSLLQQIPGLSVPSLTTNRDMLLSVLRSRELAVAVIERFRLQERYRARYLEDVVGIFKGMTDISFSKEGVISVSVEETDPALAAEIANFCIEQLDRRVSEYNLSSAGRQSVFLNAQLAGARVNLASAEDQVRNFQEKNRAVALQDQTRGAIEAAARLKGEMMASEVQLQVMRSFATEANPEVLALRRRIEEMRRQLTRMQYGDGVAQASRPARGREGRDFTVPLPNVPEIGLELARLVREAKVQETLVDLLTAQLEQTRLVQARDMPQVQILDRAVPAERPSKPRLRLNLLIAGSASLLSGLFLAFVLEYFRNTTSRPRTRPARGRA